MQPRYNRRQENTSEVYMKKEIDKGMSAIVFIFSSLNSVRNLLSE